MIWRKKRRLCQRSRRADHHGRRISNTATILFRIYPVMRIACRIARKNCIFHSWSILNRRKMVLNLSKYGRGAELLIFSAPHLHKIPFRCWKPVPSRRISPLLLQWQQARSRFHRALWNGSCPSLFVPCRQSYW